MESKTWNCLKNMLSEEKPSGARYAPSPVRKLLRPQVLWQNMSTTFNTLPLVESLAGVSGMGYTPYATMSATASSNLAAD
jgi:hypothetical protein